MRFLVATFALASWALPLVAEGVYSPTTTACSAIPTKVSPNIYYAIHQDTPTKIATNTTDELILYQEAGVTHQIDTIVSFPAIPCPTGPYKCDYHVVFDWTMNAPYNWVYGYSNTGIDDFCRISPVSTSKGAATLTWANAAPITWAHLGSFNLPEYEIPSYQLTDILAMDCSWNFSYALALRTRAWKLGT